MKKIYIEPEIYMVILGNLMDDVITYASGEGTDFTNWNNTFDEEEVVGIKNSSLWDSVDD